MAEKVFDEEVRKQLLGVLPFSVSATINYTPAQYDEIPEEFRPNFLLRAFNKAESEKVRATLLRASTMKTLDLEKATKEFVRQCVMGWDNLIDAGTMDPIDYKEEAGVGGCSKDLFDTLPVSVVGDIFKYIARISGLLNIEKLGLES